MKAITFLQCDYEIYNEDDDEYNVPFCLLEGEDQTLVTCWELTEKQIEVITKTKKIWVSQVTNGHPINLIQPSEKIPFTDEANHN
jgi:hypothetical protein